MLWHRGALDQDEDRNIKPLRDGSGLTGEAGKSFGFPLGHDLSRTAAIFLRQRRVRRLSATGLLGRHEPPHQSSLTTARTDPKHEHGHQRGEATER